MNYRHAYHAGNHGDVLKHVTLLAIVDCLQRKPAPVWVLDTHAGAGRYDLEGTEAGKTAEAASGIGRLLAGGPGPPLVAAYLDAVMAHNPDGVPRVYPGSPALVRDRLREGDRLVCCELQPEQAAALKARFSGDARVAVHQRDGYAAVKALLPPRAGGRRTDRGLVLIDPPYENQKGEFDLLLAALGEGLHRWPQGGYAVWYPIKRRREVASFLRAAAALPVASCFAAELLVRPDDSSLRMNGSGMLLLNPPWGLAPMLTEALAALHRALAENGGDWTLHWLREP